MNEHNDYLCRTMKMMVAVAALLILSACGASEPAAEQENSPPPILINPYREECEVNGELRLCYVTNVGDTGVFTPYAGEIENLAYEWGYGYEVSGSGDESRFRVEEVLNKVAEPGGIQFTLVFTGGGGRIVRIEDRLYEIYGEKAFSCAPSASCQTLDEVITVEEPITFEFESPEDPTAPLILLNWVSEAMPAQAGEEPGLISGNWMLQSFTVDENVEVPVISGSRVTAEFTLDGSMSTGKVSGNGGCNDYTADFSVSGTTITINNLERGEAQCTDPPGVLDQEQRFVSALTVAESYRVDGDSLQIVYDSGDSILHFVETDE